MYKKELIKFEQYRQKQVVGHQTDIGDVEAIVAVYIKNEIEQIKVMSLLRLKQYKLGMFNLARHPEQMSKVCSICKRIIELKDRLTKI